MQLTEYNATKQALGGPVTLSVVGDMSRSAADELFVSLWREVLYFEKKFSRFLPSSELSRFNAKAGIKTPISPEFRSILLAAKQCSEDTDDLYNFFILPALQRAGYKNSAVQGYENDAAPDYTDRRVVPSKELEIGETWALIPHGSAIDLGGMGKGYLADQLGRRLREISVAGYWLELSGDIATYGVTAESEPIAVALQDARDSGKKRTDMLVVCPEEPFGLATSGTFRRNTQSATDIVHHIIDPRTGQSATTDVLLATVCASTALEADVLASCAVTLGASKADTFLRERKMPAWVLQYKASTSDIREYAHGTNIREVIL